MNYYENSVILTPTLSEDAVKGTIEKIKSVMQEAGGQVIKADEWGSRKLAYEINKQKRGFYVFFLLKGPATLVKRLEELYKVTDNVMKFMVIKLGPKEVKALEAQLQQAQAQQAQTSQEQGEAKPGV